MTQKELTSVLDKYDNDHEFIISKAFLDGGLDPLMARLERAAGNQMSNGAAALSRYGIWANTVRDNIIEAERLMTEGNISDARSLLIRAANSLSAFSDIQALCDKKAM